MTANRAGRLDPCSIYRPICYGTTTERKSLGTGKTFDGVLNYYLKKKKCMCVYKPFHRYIAFHCSMQFKISSQLSSETEQLEWRKQICARARFIWKRRAQTNKKIPLSARTPFSCNGNARNIFSDLVTFFFSGKNLSHRFFLFAATNTRTRPYRIGWHAKTKTKLLIWYIVFLAARFVHNTGILLYVNRRIQYDDDDT